MSYVLGPREATWGPKDGVWSYQDEILGRRRINGRLVLPVKDAPLPANARVVAFHGKYDPWSADTQRMSPWVAEHYR